ncbi:hypothetical protein [Pontibacter sp. HSC-14F20]|nr:hypothetical protein [Pontibacter sp. HSC-14F20]
MERWHLVLKGGVKVERLWLKKLAEQRMFLSRFSCKYSSSR